MDLVQAEGLTHLANLVDEALDGPQRVVLWTIRLAAAKLVVEDDRPLVGQSFQRFEVNARHAGTPVQQQERRRRAAPDNLIPDAASTDADEALTRRERMRAAPRVHERSDNGDQGDESCAHEFSSGYRRFTR